MNVLTGLIFYSVGWWVVFFITLPFGINRNPTPPPGTDTGAPRTHGLLRKVTITTIISFLASAIAYWMISIGLVTLDVL